MKKVVDFIAENCLSFLFPYAWLALIGIIWAKIESKS